MSGRSERKAQLGVHGEGAEATEKELLELEGADRLALFGDVEQAAEGEIYGTARESLLGADLSDVGRVVLLGKMREDEMARAPVEDLGIGEEIADDAI